jgi:hypothetical protein
LYERYASFLRAIPELFPALYIDYTKKENGRGFFYSSPNNPGFGGGFFTPPPMILSLEEVFLLLPNDPGFGGGLFYSSPKCPLFGGGGRGSIEYN